MGKFNYAVEKRIAVLSKNEDRAESKELNLVTFNGKPAKYDIRTWRRDENGEKMLKGVTLDNEEMEALKAAIMEL